MLDRVRSAVAALPHVTDAVAVPWRDPLPMTGRHLAEVLPAARHRAPGGGGAAEAARATGPDRPTEGGRAVGPGRGPLRPPPGYPATLQDALARAAERAPRKGSPS
ncbi:hypothetical protein NKH77_01040 [Streptomyces sp. M19]